MTPPGAPADPNAAITPPEPAPGTPAAPVTDQRTEQETTAAELPFSLDDVGDDFTLTGPQAREWLVARQAQLQAPVTRTQQELADQRKAEQEWLSLRDEIETPDTREAALSKFLGKYGIELEFEEGEPGPAAVTPPEPTAGEGDDPLAQRVAELEAQRIADQQAHDEAMAARQRDEEASAAQRRVDEHTLTSLDTFAASIGLAKAEDIDAEDRGDVIRRAATLPRRADGLPDFDTAIAQHLDRKRALQEAYAASKDAPGVGATGSGGTDKADLTTAKGRLARAQAVAERHYANA